MRMQTCKQTELLQMLGVTTIGSHSHVGTITKTAKLILRLLQLRVKL